MVKGDNNIDALFVGAGIAGVSLAVGLQKQGYRVLLVERESEPRERFKGEYLQPLVFQNLSKLGLESALKNEDSTEITELKFTDLNGNGEVLSEILMKYPQGTCAYAISHYNLTKSLWKLANEILGDRFLTGATATPVNSEKNDFCESPIFQIQHNDNIFQVQPKVVFACDGRQSTVRKWLRVDLAPKNGAPVWGAKDEFIVGADVKSSPSMAHRYEVIRTRDDGTFSFFKVDASRSRLYLSARDDKATNGLKNWKKTIDSYSENLSALTVDGKWESSNVVGAPAGAFWKGPAAKGAFFLVGDALAGTTPFGGQGMTCASYQVNLLIELFSDLLENKKAEGTELVGEALKSSLKSIADKYGKAAKKWHRHVSLLNFGLFHLFFSKGKVFKRTTHAVLDSWHRAPVSQQRVMALFSGLDQKTPTPLELVRLWGVSDSKFLSQFKIPATPIQRSLSSLKEFWL